MRPRLAVLAIQADDRQTGRVVLAVGHGGVDLAADSMLGAEQPDERDARSVKQHVDRRLAVARAAGVVGHQPDLESLERAKAFLDQDVDPALDVMRRCRGRSEGGDDELVSGGAGKAGGRRPRGGIDDRGRGQGGDLGAERRRRGSAAVGMQPAGQDDRRNVSVSGSIQRLVPVKPVWPKLVGPNSEPRGAL